MDFFGETSVTVMDSWGCERDIANAAWASSADLQKLSSRSDADVRRVVTSIVQNVHGTPKERVWVDFHIVLPIAAERQFDKYRVTKQIQDVQVDFLEAPMGRLNITQNELSGRYRTLPPRYLKCPSDVAAIGERVELDLEGDFNDWLGAQYGWYQTRLTALKASQQAGTITNSEYKRVREVLRLVLGTGFFTEMRIVANLHAIEWILEQRLAADTQPESQEVARKMLAALVEKRIAPVFITETVVRLQAKGIRCDY